MAKAMSEINALQTMYQVVIRQGWTLGNPEWFVAFVKALPSFSKAERTIPAVWLSRNSTTKAAVMAAMREAFRDVRVLREDTDHA